MENLRTKEEIHDHKEGNVMNTEAITKRYIGKLILKYCGNEGQKDDETLAVTLRELLQRIITELDAESEETWRNAEIVIYGQIGEKICIRSGRAENKFVFQLDEKDEINITRTNTSRWIDALFPAEIA